jgi:hypothetical protein
MLNYLKKFALEILPSVAATVIGAYIVNHYVNKPANDAPVPAVASPAQTTKPADAGNLPQPGIKAKGISERAMMEKSASEKPAEVKPTEKPAEAKSAEAKSVEAKPAEVKPAEAKPAETASVPVEPRKHFWSREKPVAKAATATTPAPAASPATPVDTAAAPAGAEDHRDANDLARAAIERLRGNDKTQETNKEAARTVETPRSQEALRTIAPPANAAVRPLPPPIMVTAPTVEVPSNSPPYTGSIRNDDPNRPTPPAEIPPPPPVDLRADASKLATHTTNMAQDVLSAAKSMFHSVLPNNNGQQQNSSSASQFTD